MRPQATITSTIQWPETLIACRPFLSVMDRLGGRMTVAFALPITDELNRLVLNYINPLLSLNEAEFSLRLRVANGPEGIANGFEMKVPKLDKSSIIGTF